MIEPKRDTRPEGSTILCATMYGAWNAVLFLCQRAAEHGHTVTIDPSEHKATRGIPLQRVEVSL